MVRIMGQGPFSPQPSFDSSIHSFIPLTRQPEAMVFSYPALPIYDETDAIFNEMLEMFREVDIDESGTISLEEFSLVRRRAGRCGVGGG